MRWVACEIVVGRHCQARALDALAQRLGNVDGERLIRRRQGIGDHTVHGPADLDLPCLPFRG